MFVIRRKTVTNQRIGTGQGILRVKPQPSEYQYWNRGWGSNPFYYKTMKGAKAQVTINSLKGEIIEVSHEN